MRRINSTRYTLQYSTVDNFDLKIIRFLNRDSRTPSAMKGGQSLQTMKREEKMKQLYLPGG